MIIRYIYITLCTTMIVFSCSNNDKKQDQNVTPKGEFTLVNEYNTVLFPTMRVFKRNSINDTLGYIEIISENSSCIINISESRLQIDSLFFEYLTDFEKLGSYLHENNYNKNDERHLLGIQLFFKNYLRVLYSVSIEEFDKVEIVNNIYDGGLIKSKQQWFYPISFLGQEIIFGDQDCFIVGNNLTNSYTVKHYSKLGL